MYNAHFRRGLAWTLALILALPLLGTAALAADAPMELQATDVTLDETEFTYTGQEIRPNVTVRVNGQPLTLDQDYTLEFTDNIEVGEAKVTVTGIGSCTGAVEVPFFIREPETEPEFTLVTLTEEMVTLERSEFVYSGQPIEPAVTVTVDGQTLERDKDFTVEYVSNLVPGTGTVIVRGIVTASGNLGYTGEVRKTFTITEAPQTEPTQPETSEPTQPSEPAKPEYQITKGDKASWTQGSAAALSFTADGPFADFEGVSVDGKKLDKDQFEAKAGTVVLLKNAFLKTLKAGEHKITLHFAEADAEGTFTVSAADENPKTGDMIAAWILTMTLTGTALVLMKKRA